MISLNETRTGDPVEQWCQDHVRTPPPLRYSLALAMPGGLLTLRTNHSGLSAYARNRCRYFLHPNPPPAKAVAEVLCFPGKTWPAVRPRSTAGALTAESFNTFQSVAQPEILYTWKPPTLMGSLRPREIPQIRVVATEPNPRLFPRPLNGQRLKITGTGFEYPDMLDLVFCLLGRHRGFTVLHGAVLEKNGLGVLLLGESGCGKTTAALTLMRGGFRIVTDECAVLWNRGRERGRFGGILVPPMVVGRPFRMLSRLEQTLGQPRTFGKNVVPVPGNRVQLKPVKVTAMFSLRRPETRTAMHQATPLTPPDAFAILMSQVLDPVTSGRVESCEAMLNFVEKAGAYQVTAGSELATLPAFIERLATGRAPNSRRQP